MGLTGHSIPKLTCCDLSGKIELEQVMASLTIFSVGDHETLRLRSLHLAKAFRSQMIFGNDSI